MDKLTQRPKYFYELHNWDYDAKLGDPGQYPYTRGIYPTMYHRRLWTMRQYAGFGDAQQTNQFFKYLMQQGQTGLSVAFDLPTQMGYDSDSNQSIGEVGNVGVAIDTLDDMKLLFDGIALDQVSTSMTINAPATILMAMYIIAAEEQGVKQQQLRGTIQNDILKEYVARGTYIFPPLPSLRLVTDLIEYCTNNCQLFNSISISGYHMREAGCTASQEIGFTFANAIEYINHVIKRGIDIDRFGPRLSFFFSVHNHLFEEIAKFRAARRLWAKIMKERFSATNLDAIKLKFHSQTSGSTLTAQQPENNISRVTLQALAAVLGGTQSLHTNSFDEALSLPSPKAAKIALRTQQIIAHETGVIDVVDPLGGSFYIEALTDNIEKEASQYIKKVDEMGGMVRAIEKGYVQNQIHNSSYEYMMAVEKREKIIVGVNSYKEDLSASFKLKKIQKNIQSKQIKRLKNIKAARNNNKATSSLKNLAATAETDENIMPALLEAIRNYCTIGELCDILREKWRTYQEYNIV